MSNWLWDFLWGWNVVGLFLIFLVGGLIVDLVVRTWRRR